MSHSFSTSKSLAQRNCHFNHPAMPKHPARSVSTLTARFGLGINFGTAVASNVCLLTFLPSASQFDHVVPGGKRCAPHRRPDLLLLFLARTFGVPPHGPGRDTSCVVVPSVARGVSWVQTAFVFEFSFISDFRFFCRSFFLTNSCFSSQIFLVTD